MEKYESILLIIIAIFIIVGVVTIINPSDNRIVDDYHIISIQPSDNNIVVRYLAGNDTTIRSTIPLNEIYSNDVRLISNNSFGISYFTLYWNGTLIK